MKLKYRWWDLIWKKRDKIGLSGPTRLKNALRKLGNLSCLNHWRLIERSRRKTHEAQERTNKQLYSQIMKPSSAGLKPASPWWEARDHITTPPRASHFVAYKTHKPFWKHCRFCFLFAAYIYKYGKISIMLSVFSPVVRRLSRIKTWLQNIQFKKLWNKSGNLPGEASGR